MTIDGTMKEVKDKKLEQINRRRQMSETNMKWHHVAKTHNTR